MSWIGHRSEFLWQTCWNLCNSEFGCGAKGVLILDTVCSRPCAVMECLAQRLLILLIKSSTIRDRKSWTLPQRLPFVGQVSFHSWPRELESLIRNAWEHAWAFQPMALRAQVLATGYYSTRHSGWLLDTGSSELRDCGFKILGKTQELEASVQVFGVLVARSVNLTCAHVCIPERGRYSISGKIRQRLQKCPLITPVKSSALNGRRHLYSFIRFNHWKLVAFTHATSD